MYRFENGYQTYCSCIGYLIDLFYLHYIYGIQYREIANWGSTILGTSLGCIYNEHVSLSTIEDTAVLSQSLVGLQTGRDLIRSPADFLA